MNESNESPARVLLVGNPNVGKSAVFSRLTGAHVIASNYPGTTVEFSEGKMNLGDSMARVIDVPGTYTLEPVSRAEEVALEMLEHGDIVVNVVDATNLERNLNLTLQLLRTDMPVVVALNMWDEAQEHGVEIDLDELEQQLGVPVVPTCAISGEGIQRLRKRLEDARPGNWDFDDGDKWCRIGEVVESVQKVTHRHPTLADRLSHLTVHPVLGLIFGAFVLFISFEAVRFIGEGLIGYVMEPLFNTLWLPVVEKLSQALGSGGFFHDILIGQLVEGQIDFEMSFGLLSTALYIPLAAVLPYVVAFYLALSVLEDIGYLPRLGVLVDNIMHRVGLHGLSIVPMMLGLGCNVPGTMATRIVETRKERFIACTLLAISVPCMAQIAMVAGLLGEYGARGFLPVFGTLLFLWVVLGMILNKFTHGETPEFLADIPPYRMPHWPTLLKKLWMRVRAFLKEAVPYVLLGVLLVNIMFSVGVIKALRGVFEPVVKNLLGLPAEAVGALIMGFLRKDIAVGMLAPLDLSLRQLIVASVVLTAYFPCAATFVMMFKELGVRDMLKATVIMVVVAFATGGLLNFVLLAFGM